MISGFPWDFRVGPGTASERRHMTTMIAGMPPGSMLVADAGFAGYPLCRRLLLADHSFLIRVGGNITLLEGLNGHVEDRRDLVHLWPTRHKERPPLILRRIIVKSELGDHDGEVHMLANILKPSQLTDAEAMKLYKSRWGEEVFFRTYKQTMRRSRLPSRRRRPACWKRLGR
jgi:hypothetical protein